jgi:hypothetical protein
MSFDSLIIQYKCLSFCISFYFWAFICVVYDMNFIYCFLQIWCSSHITLLPSIAFWELPAKQSPIDF